MTISEAKKIIKELKEISDFTREEIKEIIETAENGSDFELLGELMLKNIDDVQSALVSNDGYVHHFGHYEDKDGIVRYEKAKTREELKEQLDDFEKKAEEGKLICLTDLMISAGM